MADEEQQQPLLNNIDNVAVGQPRAMAVKLAEFWLEEPALWFTQAEAQFRRGLVMDGRLRLQALFMQRLPVDMRDHLVAANLENPREMAILADRMWDSRSDKAATVAAVRGASPAERGRDRHQRSPRRRAHTPHPDGLCFFHGRFGAKAHRCSPPCTWTGPLAAGNGPAAGGN